MKKGLVAAALWPTLICYAGLAHASDPGLQEWVRVAPEKVASECGLDPVLLREADRMMGNNPYAIVRYGKLCHEYLNTTGVYHVASITKFMASLTLGIATTKTQLSDESPVVDYLNWWELGGINPQAKVAHVLAMTATKPDLSWGAKGIWIYDALGTREIDKLITIVDRALAREPKAFPGVTNMAQLARTQLFEKIGMRNTQWSGYTLAYSMNSTVRDMARLGLLALRKGVWSGKRILSEEYVYRMGHPAFEDTNTGYGYLLMMNAQRNWTYSSGSNDPDCAPVSLWNQYPHRPFYEALTCNGGTATCSQVHDVGTQWAAGAGGQKVVIHPGLDLVMVVRDDLTNEGHNRVWDAVRPALVKRDPAFLGDEAGFCQAYKNNQYAPDLR
ncbi:MAG: serine hydrolase [Pseudomonadota bacterium]